MRAQRLPPGLGAAFTAAEARAAGVTASRLRARDLERPFRGMRVVQPPFGRAASDDGLDGRAQRIRALAQQYALVMPPEQFFSHVTAALLWRLPVPPGVLLETDGDGFAADRLDVAVHAPARTPRAARIRGHQVQPRSADVGEVDGIRVATPATTWAMLGGVLRDHRDLVAVGDAVVRQPMFRLDPPALATTAELDAAVSAGRRPGVRALRIARPRIRTRSASRPETWMRLAVLDAGLPEPELNAYISDVSGRLIACVDAAYREYRIALEYEGDHHRVDPAQWARDIERHAALADAGWVVIRVTKQQIFGSSSFVPRLRRALAARC